MLKPILLVEDNPHDLELTLIALERSQLANEVIVVRDGADALDYLHARGGFASPQAVAGIARGEMASGLDIQEKK